MGIIVACALHLGQSEEQHSVPAQAERAVLDAREALRTGHFATALGHYAEAELDPSVPRGPLRYEQGLCAYRLERWAESIARFESALLHLPGDPDTEHNLQLARQRLGIESPPSTWWQSAGRLVDRVGVFRVTLALAVLQCVLVLGLAFARLLRWRRRTCIALIALLLMTLLAELGVLIQLTSHQPPRAVVLAAAANVHHDAHTATPILAAPRAGEIVEVLESSDRWTRVRFGTAEGWVQAAELLAIQE